MLTQPPAVVLKLLSYLVATTTKGIYSKEPEQQCNDALAQALKLEMAKWWTVSGGSYLDHVSKDRVFAVVNEAVDAAAASPLSSLKKADAVAVAELALAGKGWLPEVLRVGARVSEDSGPTALAG